MQIGEKMLSDNNCKDIFSKSEKSIFRTKEDFVIKCKTFRKLDNENINYFRKYSFSN